MLVQVLLVVSLALVARGDGGQTTQAACAPERAVLESFRVSANPDLEGIYKFYWIYDPTTVATNRRHDMCLHTEYTPQADGKVKVFSPVTFMGKEELAKITEYATKDSEKTGYYKMEGEFKQLHVLEGQEDGSSRYTGEFVFFHNEHGVLGYSACSADTKGKGITLIISVKSSLKDEAFKIPENPGAATDVQKSLEEAKRKLKEIAEKLLKIEQEEGKGQGLEVDKHIYLVNSNCP